jgi:mannose-1-phosphate guanylyltransferase
MKAFLLAAGHGTRLRPLTDHVPKCLVPIQGVTILDIWIELCRRAGVSELFVNLHAHADAVRTALGQADRGIKVRLSEEKVLLGSAGTLLSNRDWVASEPEFWVLYADVLTTADLSKMIAFHRSHRPPATIGLYQVNNPSQCGVVAFDSNQVVREFVEKPLEPRGNWAFSGLLIGTPELLDVIPPKLPADLGYHVLPRLVGRMMAYPISDYLVDIGTLERYEAAQTSWPGLPR